MLNVLVLFGSQSDQHVYEQITRKLSEFCQVDFAVISAHRDPDALEVKLQETKADIIVAGAGIAAHLPGVIASKVKVPVIGVPVASVFSGLDALASIQQMPFGVPVLATSPDDSDRLCKFINDLGKRQTTAEHINLVFPQDKKNDKAFQKELARTRLYAAENGMELKESAFLDDSAMNIVLVSDESEIIEDSTILHIPILSDEDKKRPETLCRILKWVNKGGLWLGVNNCRNALIYINKLNNMRTK